MDRGRNRFARRRTAIGLSLGASLALIAATARPTAASDASAACVHRFDTSTTGLATACMFVGRYNASCGSDAIAIFAGDGTALVVALSIGPGTPTLFVPAQVVSPTEGKLVRWRPDLDLRAAPSLGHVALDDAGQRLRITLNGAPLQVGTCRFDEYIGEFAGMAPAQPLAARAF
jgi:hypothetical protein